MVCKHCGAEVSPYITECPYCGHRLQKRAPKIGKDGKPAEHAPRRMPSPTLPRLRPGEIPGIRHDTHPYATILLVVLGFLGTLLLRTNLVPGDLILTAPLSFHWWRMVTTVFVYSNTGYTVITLGAIALFGTLLERRHGPFAVLALFLVGGVAGGVVAVEAGGADLAMGGNGAALALATAWAMPDLISAARDGEFDGDLLGAAVIGVVVALMPLVASEATWAADAVGVSAGILIGYPVARLHPV